MQSLYSLNKIRVFYASAGIEGGRIEAVRDLTLDIYPGQLIVILGANGSGKSSLGKLLAGIAPDFGGELYYKSHKIDNYSRMIFDTVSMVLQEPQNQILMPTIARELAMPLENRGVKSKIIDETIHEIASLFGLENIMDRNPEELSGGQMTALAIASALITGPETVILDEPDSHLDKKTQAVLDEFINNYRQKINIILISQFPESGLTADRVLILNNGRLVADDKPANVLSDENVMWDNNLRFKKSRFVPVAEMLKVGKSSRVDMGNKNVVLTAKGVGFVYPAAGFKLTNINLAIYESEKVGLVGPAGSGKSTLCLLLAGLLKPVRGDIFVFGKAIGEYRPESLRRLVTMAIQFPEKGLFEDTVADDIAFGPKNLGYDSIDERVNQKLKEFNIAELKDRHPFYLSGGEKRKTALAGIMAMNSQIVILDEPSASLDPKSVGELSNHLQSQRNLTFIIVSHDLEFIAGTCERVIALDKGQIVYDMPADAFLKNNKWLESLNEGQ